VKDVRRILIPVVAGSRVRNLLRTDLFRELCSKAEIVIASPAYDYAPFVKEFSDPNVTLEPFDLGSSRRKIEILLQTMETWVPNPKYAATHTYRIIVDELKRTRPAIGNLRAIENRVISTKFGAQGARIARSLIGKVDYHLPPERQHYTPFERRPSLVFTDYPFHYCYRPFLKIAKKRRIPLFCFVTSWDNLTCKGELPVRMDRLVVWNDIMKKEAMELYDYSWEDIFCSGPPQFDIYFRKGWQLPREEFLRSVGLDPNKKLITYCTGAGEFLPLEFEVTKLLLRWIRDHRFAKQCQLLVRLHPGRAREWAERFQSLQGKDVYIDLPGTSEIWLDHWDPVGADTRYLANILLNSDVVVNLGSTVTIEASCLDRPIVNMAFEGVRQYYGFNHYANILRTGGVRMAGTREELFQQVEEYLENPTLDAEGRRRIVREQCYYTDGKSSQRVAEFVLEALESAAG
jgi:hypothetical protein